MSKKFKIIMMAVIFLLLAGAVYGFEYFRLKQADKNGQSEINSFQACALAGNPIMESYPEQCRTKDGRTFIRPLTEEEQSKLKPPAEICKNLCGDGICQEIVCLSSGCPCSESNESCSADCSTESSGAGIANPASVYCEKQGGKVEIRTDESGGQAGYCQFPDGHECEEWALMRGECAIK